MANIKKSNKQEISLVQKCKNSSPVIPHMEKASWAWCESCDNWCRHIGEFS
jgi:hypothetical protein